MKKLMLFLLLALPALGGRDFVNASSQYYTNAIPTKGAYPLTIAVFLNPTVNDAAIAAICVSTSTNAWGHELILVGSIAGDPYRASTVTSSGANAQGGPFTTNQWQHVAGVFSASNLRILYTNGVSAVTNSNSRALVNVDTVTVGARFLGTPSLYFDGSLAEVGVWSDALTPDEILSLSIGASPLLIRPTSLIFYSPLNGGSAEPNLIGGPLVGVNSPAASANHPRIYRP